MLKHQKYDTLIEEKKREVFSPGLHSLGKKTARDSRLTNLSTKNLPPPGKRGSSHETFPEKEFGLTGGRA